MAKWQFLEPEHADMVHVTLLCLVLGLLNYLPLCLPSSSLSLLIFHSQLETVLFSTACNTLSILKYRCSLHTRVQTDSSKCRFFGNFDCYRAWLTETGLVISALASAVIVNCYFYSSYYKCRFCNCVILFDDETYDWVYFNSCLWIWIELSNNFGISWTPAQML